MTRPDSPGRAAAPRRTRSKYVQWVLLILTIGLAVIAAIVYVKGKTAYSFRIGVLGLSCFAGMIVNGIYRAFMAWWDTRRSLRQSSRNPGRAPAQPLPSGLGSPDQPDLQVVDPALFNAAPAPSLVPATAPQASPQPAARWNPVTPPAACAMASAVPWDTRDETAPALPFQAGRVAASIVFDSPSAAGQAPWLLPEGSAVRQSGLAADGAQLGDLEIRAATAVGADHRCGHPARPRQDAYSLDQTPDGRYLLAAVADGVSNSEQSDLGARIAATRATRDLSATIAGTGRHPADPADFATNIAREMAATAKGRGIPEDEVQCVLAVAAIPAQPEPNGLRLLWVAWIGDASVWLRRGGELHSITGERKRGPDPNTLSSTLPFHPRAMRATTCWAEPGDSVIVMSDGLSDSLDMVGEVREYFASQWSGRPPHPAAFLYSLCYDAPGQYDDRTAIVTWCGADGQQRGEPW